MTPPLFLLDPLPDVAEFVLGGDEGHHAARVMRLGVGERVLVSDGRGAVCECVVVEALREGLRLRVEGRHTDPTPRPRLVVVQALAKGDRGELAVEVMTELGVDEIVPWSAARSITQWRDARGAKALDKWRRTATEAAKQSRRARVPVVAGLAATRDVAALLRAASAALVLHEDAPTSLADCPLADDGDIVVVVGPEGGVSDGELTCFTDASAVPVRMGRPVLRTSTAGAAALAALAVRLGRWA